MMQYKYINQTVLTLSFILAVGCIISYVRYDVEANEFQFSLNARCPASFEKTETGTCAFRSLYQIYESPENYGGLRTRLPEMRDSFTPQLIDLGRYLFFDPVLSRDKTVSCAHCHHPDYGFADGRGLSMGKGGKGIGPERENGDKLPRSAPSIWNVGFLKNLTWDGRADDLASQAEIPLFLDKEMNNSPENLEKTLNMIPTYRRLFGEVFDLKDDESITTENVTKALAAFQSTLVSFNSRYDRYAHGDETALTPQEIEGHNIFRSFVTRCSQCHSPPLFTIDELAVIGVPNLPGAPFDPGAEIPLNEPKMRGGFKVPTLRNIALTAPYMHAGNFKTLSEVVNFYNDKRGHAIPEGEQLTLHWHIHLQSPSLSKQEVGALVSFLNSLTDETMMPIIPVAVPSDLPVVEVLPRGMTTTSIFDATLTNEEVNP